MKAVNLYHDTTANSIHCLMFFHDNTKLETNVYVLYECVGKLTFSHLILFFHAILLNMGTDGSSKRHMAVSRHSRAAAAVKCLFLSDAVVGDASLELFST